MINPTRLLAAFTCAALAALDGTAQAQAQRQRHAWTVPATMADSFGCLAWDASGAQPSVLLSARGKGGLSRLTLDGQLTSLAPGRASHEVASLQAWLDDFRPFTVLPDGSVEVSDLGGGSFLLGPRGRHFFTDPGDPVEVLAVAPGLEGQPPLDALFNFPAGAQVGSFTANPEGSLDFIDYEKATVCTLLPPEPDSASQDFQVQTMAGSGLQANGGHANALRTHLERPCSLALGADGRRYLSTFRHIYEFTPNGNGTWHQGTVLDKETCVLFQGAGGSHARPVATLARDGEDDPRFDRSETLASTPMGGLLLAGGYQRGVIYVDPGDAHSQVLAKLILDLPATLAKPDHHDEVRALVLHLDALSLPVPSEAEVLRGLRQRTPHPFRPLAAPGTRWRASRQPVPTPLEQRAVEHIRSRAAERAFAAYLAKAELEAHLGPLAPYRLAKAAGAEPRAGDKRARQAQDPGEEGPETAKVKRD